MQTDCIVFAQQYALHMATQEPFNFTAVKVVGRQKLRCMTQNCSSFCLGCIGVMFIQIRLKCVCVTQPDLPNVRRWRCLILLENVPLGRYVLRENTSVV